MTLCSLGISLDQKNSDQMDCTKPSLGITAKLWNHSKISHMDFGALLPSAALSIQED